MPLAKRLLAESKQVFSYGKLFTCLAMCKFKHFIMAKSLHFQVVVYCLYVAYFLWIEKINAIVMKNIENTSETSSFKVVESDHFKKDDIFSIAFKSPVILMASKIQAFFNGFKDINVGFDEEDPIVYIYSLDYSKTDALNRFLVHKHEFGNLSLDVKVVNVVNGIAIIHNPPSWKIPDDSIVEAFKCIFEHSPMRPNFTQAVDHAGTTWNFFEFPGYAVTYQASSSLNIRGYEAMLAADLAKDIFSIPAGYQISAYAYADEDDFA